MHKVLAQKNPKDARLLGLLTLNCYLRFDLTELINAVTAFSKPVIAIINPAYASTFISYAL